MIRRIWTAEVLLLLVNKKYGMIRRIWTNEKERKKYEHFFTVNKTDVFWKRFIIIIS